MGYQTLSKQSIISEGSPNRSQEPGSKGSQGWRVLHPGPYSRPQGSKASAHFHLVSPSQGFSTSPSTAPKPPSPRSCQTEAGTLEGDAGMESLERRSRERGWETLSKVQGA